MKNIAILGGSGLVGCRLASKLLSLGHSVTIIDVAPVNDINLARSICDEDYLNKALIGIDGVIIVASYGMSGAAMLDGNVAKNLHDLLFIVEKCFSINVNGVTSVLNACSINKIKWIIYTSTVNVVFGGKPIMNGDETLPLFPIDKYTDAYSWTKQLAETLVLQNNTAEFTSCAIRPASIYGSGEQRHFPRIVSLMDWGMFFFVIGDNQVRLDWIHVDNLVAAYCCAVGKLSSSSKLDIGGKAYFVSDDAPVNNFDFLKPLAKCRNAPFPTLRIPTVLMHGLAYCCEMIYYLIWNVSGVKSNVFLTRAEVAKVGITNTFSNLLAKKELGYLPVKSPDEGMNDLLSDYCHLPTVYFRFVNPIHALMVIIGLGYTYLCAYDNDMNSMVCTVGGLIFGGRAGMKLVWLIALACHVFEALYALFKARGYGLKLICVCAWTVQTFLFGFLSLSRLGKFEDNLYFKSKKRL